VESYSGALAISFAGDNTTTVKEKWTCFADVIQVRPIWHPPFVLAAPFPAPLTVVWCHRGLGHWLFPDECCSKQGTFSMRSRRRMWCESVLRLVGFCVMAMRVSVISEKIHAMHSILFVFLLETVQTQCHNQWTHGRGGGQCSIRSNCEMWWTGMSLDVFPDLNPIQSSSRQLTWKKFTASSTTSLSTVLK